MECFEFYKNFWVIPVHKIDKKNVLFIYNTKYNFLQEPTFARLKNK